MAAVLPGGVLPPEVHGGVYASLERVRVRALAEEARTARSRRPGRSGV